MANNRTFAYQGVVDRIRWLEENGISLITSRYGFVCGVNYDILVHIGGLSEKSIAEIREIMATPPYRLRFQITKPGNQYEIYLFENDAHRTQGEIVRFSSEATDANLDLFRSLGDNVNEADDTSPPTM